MKLQVRWISYQNNYKIANIYLPWQNCFADHQVSPLRKNIFFLETCCGESMVLNPRQACSIESAAKNNPDRDVHLFVINPKKVSNESTQLIHQLLTYPNIQISRIKADDYMKDTPLEQWYAHKPMKTSQWPNVHLSDVLRLITLWKYPGIYLDLDVVVMKYVHPPKPSLKKIQYTNWTLDSSPPGLSMRWNRISQEHNPRIPSTTTF